MAGSNETKAISASNLKLKLKLTEAELGNTHFYKNVEYISVYKKCLFVAKKSIKSQIKK